MITNLKPYPAYKDSGVEWLGKVPAHWEVRRLASCLRTIESGSREQIDTDAENGIPNLGGEHIGRDGQLLLINMRYISRRYFQSLRKGVVKENDILLVKDGATIGKVAIVRVLPYSECTVNEHVFILRSAKDCLSGFIYHSMRSQGLQELIWHLVTGSAQPGLNSTFTKGVHLSLPPLPEQTAIVRFLDYIERRIRRAIRAKQKRIKLLEEYKQALIHHAVTGQIDVRTGKPYPVYKDSGVEWLGKMPEHWEVKPIKRAFSYMDYGISESGSDSGTIRLLTMRHLKNGQVIIPDTGGVDTVDPNLLLSPGDLLFNRTNSAELVGKVALFSGYESPVTFASYLVRMRPTKENEPEFLNLVLNDVSTLSRARREAIPSLHQSNLNPTRYGRMYIALPPKAEQQAILQRLREKTAKIDAVVASAQREIELLREYRERLISDVVTGKVDVREVASQLPEEPETPEEEEPESLDEEVANDESEQAEEENSPDGEA